VSQSKESERERERSRCRLTIHSRCRKNFEGQKGTNKKEKERIVNDDGVTANGALVRKKHTNAEKGQPQSVD
jgi:hypothetical protein